MKRRSMLAALAGLLGISRKAIAADRPALPAEEMRAPLFKVFHHKSSWGSTFHYDPKKNGRIQADTETIISHEDAGNLTDDQIKAEYRRLRLIPPVYKGYKRIEVLRFDVVRGDNVGVIYNAIDKYIG